MKTAKTLAELARALGRPKQVVHRWSAREWWTFKAPYPVAAVKKAAEKARGERAGGDEVKAFVKETKLGPLQQARLKRLLEQIATDKLNRELKLGMYVARSVAEAENQAKAAYVKRAFEGLPGAIAADLGLDDNGRKVVEGHVKRVLHMFAGDTGGSMSKK